MKRAHDHGHAHEHATAVRPEENVAPSSRATAAATIWTCPMHPEIRRDAPGACPICGMALEPLAPSAEEGENHELQDMTRRFWVGVVLWAGWPFFVRGGQSVVNRSLNMFTLIALGTGAA